MNRNAIPLLTTYLCLMALSVGMFFMARNFPGAHMGAASPGFFPQVIAVVLFLLSLLGIAELRSAELSPVRIPPRVLVAMALSLGYIGLMHYIGYYPSTLVVGFAIMALTRSGTHWLRILIDSILLVTFSYLFFEVMIDAYLPTGVLFAD